MRRLLADSLGRATASRCTSPPTVKVPRRHCVHCRAMGMFSYRAMWEHPDSVRAQAATHGDALKPAAVRVLSEWVAGLGL